MNKEEFKQLLLKGVKRGLDLIVAVLGLILVLPIMLVIAFAIQWDSDGPIFYQHRRIGKDGKPFNIFKFRSMVSGGDDGSYMQYLRDLIESERNGTSKGLPYKKMMGDPRVTRVGSFIRKYYLDELPQMINIIKGDMSLVGPRPHVQFEVENYTPDQRRRLSVRPGATGLWQVIGKSDATFNELINLDLDYIDHWSIWLDIQIMFRTMLLMLPGGEQVWARMAKHVPARIPVHLPVRSFQEDASTNTVLGDNWFVEYPEISRVSSKEE